jgi:hypothetical protein
VQVLINAGQANAATGDRGYQDCHISAKAVAEALGVSADDILLLSTGVIGRPIKMDALLSSVPKLAANLGRSAEDAHHAAVAITTTDLVSKSAAIQVSISPSPLWVLIVLKIPQRCCGYKHHGSCLRIGSQFFKSPYPPPFPQSAPFPSWAANLESSEDAHHAAPTLLPPILSANRPVSLLDLPPPRGVGVRGHGAKAANRAAAAAAVTAMDHVSNSRG